MEILYKDQQYVAVYKPQGLLVHRTHLLEKEKEFALQKVRNQLKRRVYTVHRLDRPTAGVLLFALQKGSARRMIEMFKDRVVKKTYLALVRGFTEESGIIDMPLVKNPQEGHKYKDAITDYKRLAKGVLPIPMGKYKQVWYSLVAAYPHTGRMHQIRKHFAHIQCPIVGDRPHGDWKHNRLFAEKLDAPRLFLLAQELSFTHPYTQEIVTIKADLTPEMKRIFVKFGWGNMFDIPQLEQEKLLVEQELREKNKATAYEKANNKVVTKEPLREIQQENNLLNILKKQRDIRNIPFFNASQAAESEEISPQK